MQLPMADDQPDDTVSFWVSVTSQDAIPALARIGLAEIEVHRVVNDHTPLMDRVLKMAQTSPVDDPWLGQVMFMLGTALNRAVDYHTRLFTNPPAQGTLPASLTLHTTWFGPPQPQHDIIPRTGDMDVAFDQITTGEFSPPVQPSGQDTWMVWTAGIDPVYPHVVQASCTVPASRLTFTATMSTNPAIVDRVTAWLACSTIVKQLESSRFAVALTADRTDDQPGTYPLTVLQNAMDPIGKLVDRIFAKTPTSDGTTTQSKIFIQLALDGDPEHPLPEDDPFLDRMAVSMMNDQEIIDGDVMLLITQPTVDQIAATAYRIASQERLSRVTFPVGGGY